MSSPGSAQLLQITCGVTASSLKNWFKDSEEEMKPIFFTILCWSLLLVESLFANSVVRFSSNVGEIDMELFDTQKPLTVANFLFYVNAGRYNQSFIHRSVPGFVIQGGGFGLNGTSLSEVQTNPAVRNEPGISNVRGTVAMAKQPDDPNSATSGWFINLADNSQNPKNLDAQNGGFTVFGRVLGNGMAVADRIAAFSTYNATAQLGGAFGELPLQGDSLNKENFILFSDVRALPAGTVVREFDFSAGDQGFASGFADLPAGDNPALYNLVADHRNLPAELGGGKALFISGVNSNAGLWMFWKKKITGLQPNTEYQVALDVEMASNVAGVPGESVYVKAGVSQAEPLVTPDSQGLLRLTVDKGNQSTSGSVAAVLGNIAKENNSSDQYGIVYRNNRSVQQSATTSADGSLWIFFGTDSEFQGATSLYCTHAAAVLSPKAKNSVVRFSSNVGEIDMELFDTETPFSVANFLFYVNAGRYNQSFIHGSVPGLLIQGGGFGLNGNSLSEVQTNPAVRNEPRISNLRGTVAMAKLGDNPHSATSRWLINLANNLHLDELQDGFTVFGRVVGNGMVVADRIAAFPTYEVYYKDNLFFDVLPLQGAVPSQQNKIQLEEIPLQSLILFSSVRALPAGTVVREFDFSAGDQGFASGFADLPAGDNPALYNLVADHRNLPAELGGGKGLFISGTNRSDDLWMFWKKKLTGLQPNTEYQVVLDVEMASNVVLDLVGVGGAPGESVYVKAGVSQAEPLVAPDSQGWLRLTVDKGNQSTSGSAAAVLGNVAKENDDSEQYAILHRNNRSVQQSGTTSADGSLWIFFGTDSGFEGTTSLYYTHAAAVLSPKAMPPLPPVGGGPGPASSVAGTPKKAKKGKKPPAKKAAAPKPKKPAASKSKSGAAAKKPAAKKAKKK